MGSWVYVFSKFTPEALLFEALFIFTLSAGYAAFWVIRKRQLGAADTVVPAGVVKVYLNQMIQDAEQMRAQLFGLLRAAGVPAGVETMGGAAAMPQPMAMPAGLSADPALLAKIAQLEAKMTEQAKSMQEMSSVKAKLEKELAALRASKGAKAGDAAASAETSEKIAALEARLAEYSVIEDDLANLKRLQQENTQLRAALSGKGGSPDAVIAAGTAAVAAATPSVAAAAAAIAGDDTLADASLEEELAEAGAAETELDAGADLLAADSSADASADADAFEGLVDQVEESLQPAAPAAVIEEEVQAVAAAPTPVAAAPIAPSVPAPVDSKEQSDADLVAEFEKMLNS